MDTDGPASTHRLGLRRAAYYRLSPAWRRRARRIAFAPLDAWRLLRGTASYNGIPLPLPRRGLHRRRRLPPGRPPLSRHLPRHRRLVTRRRRPRYRLRPGSHGHPAHGVPVAAGHVPWVRHRPFGRGRLPAPHLEPLPRIPLRVPAGDERPVHRRRACRRRPSSSRSRPTASTSRSRRPCSRTWSPPTSSGTSSRLDASSVRAGGSSRRCSSWTRSRTRASAGIGVQLPVPRGRCLVHGHPAAQRERRDRGRCLGEHGRPLGLEGRPRCTAGHGPAGRDRRSSSRTSRSWSSHTDRATSAVGSVLGELALEDAHARDVRVGVHAPTRRSASRGASPDGRTGLRLDRCPGRRSP